MWTSLPVIATRLTGRIGAVHVRPNETRMPLSALTFPDIDPVAIAIGPFAIRWYALAYIAGLVGGWYYARRLVQAEHLWAGLRRPTPTDVDDLIVWVALGVVLGGRFGYILFYDFESYLTDPLEMLAIWRGGMSFHGGFLGSILALILFARTRGLNALSMLDLAAVVTPIGLFFGRLANFVNGDLWGRPAADFPFAFVFPHGGPLPRHPSQLYEAFGEGLILFVIMALAVRRFGFRRPGLLGGIFVLGYALARIVCEFFREPDPQLGFLFGASIQALAGGVTMGMLLSIPMALVGLIAIWLAARGFTRPDTAPRTSSGERVA
jgi:phosphatidylglycerol:prolipoprotein diacylglycerol transferase